MFRAIQLETMDFCNRSCGFCPNSRRPGSRDRLMPLNLLARIVGQLKAIGYRGRVSPYLRNEPLMDNRICDIIGSVRDELPGSVISLNTNGDRLLDEGFARTFFKSGIDAVIVNCYDGEEAYQRMMSLVRSLQSRGLVALWSEHARLLDMPARDAVVNVTVKRVFTAKDSFWNRGGSVPDVAPAGKYANLRNCKYPSRQMYVTYSGKAVICCSDWDEEVVLGDLTCERLSDVWCSRRYERYRTLHAEGRFKELPLCDRCNRVS